jgi:hypothetical protein
MLQNRVNSWGGSHNSIRHEMRKAWGAIPATRPSNVFFEVLITEIARRLEAGFLKNVASFL